MDLEANNKKIIEVDLSLLFIRFINYWYVLIIAILIGALAGILNYSVISTPKYKSTGMVYLRSSSKKISLESLQLNTSLTNDYEIIFTSRPNLEQVIDKLHLSCSVKQLKRMVTIENPDETRILEISVKAKSPELAKNITNSIIEFGMDDIREVDSQEPYIIEKGIVSNERVGLTLAQSAMLGAIVVLFIVICVFIIQFMADDKFHSSDNVEEYLGLPVLAVIAEDKSLAYAKLEATSSRRRKHHGKKTSK